MKLLEVLEVVDREAFEFMFGRELTYTMVRSDQRVVELIPGGSSTVVRYEDRKEFIRLVQRARLEESKEQVMLSPRAGVAPRGTCSCGKPSWHLWGWWLQKHVPKISSSWVVALCIPRPGCP